MEVAGVILTVLVTAPITIIIIVRFMRMVLMAIKCAMPYLIDVVPTCEEIKAAYANVGWHFETADAPEEVSKDTSGEVSFDTLPETNTRFVPSYALGDEAVVRASAIDAETEHLFSNLMGVDIGARANQETIRAAEHLLVKLNALGVGKFCLHGTVRIIQARSDNSFHGIQIIVVDRSQDPSKYFTSGLDYYLTTIFFNDFSAEQELFDLIRVLMSAKRPMRPTTYYVPGESNGSAHETPRNEHLELVKKYNNKDIVGKYLAAEIMRDLN